MKVPALARYKSKSKTDDSFWVKIGVEDQQTDRTKAVHQGFYTHVYDNIVKKTALSQSEFAHITAISVSTLKCRLKQDTRFITTESDVMYRLATLLNQATDLFSGDEKKGKLAEDQRLWLKQQKTYRYDCHLS
jgi:putative toxin-antitoxin system antitoxin component (TIGR02293 family)